MAPLNNLQVAVKNNIDVFYFCCIVPYHVYFVEDGEMGKLDSITHSVYSIFFAYVNHWFARYLVEYLLVFLEYSIRD